MRVLGIDPGLTRCGVAVIDGLPGRPVTAHFVGVITTAADGELADRLAILHAELTVLIDKYSPEVIAIERVFSQQNVRSAMSTAQAAGIGLLLAGQRGIRVGMHTPTEVKAAVTPERSGREKSGRTDGHQNCPTESGAQTGRRGRCPSDCHHSSVARECGSEIRGG